MIERIISAIYFIVFVGIFTLFGYFLDWLMGGLDFEIRSYWLGMIVGFGCSVPFVVIFDKDFIYPKK